MMKRNQTKKKLKKKNSPARYAPDSYDTSLNDLGLEPPKIYREAQQRKLSENGGSAARRSSNHLTRNQRRAQETKKRKKRNRMRKAFIWIGVLLFVAALGTVLSLTVFFPINSINVAGNKIYSAEEILTACTIDKGENLFMSDTAKAKQTIEEVLPYIYNAEIRRKLPNTIEINVTEAKASYSIRNKDKTYILLDDRFKVLETAAEKAGGVRISKADIKSAVPGHKIEFSDKNTGACLEQLAAVVKTNEFTEITSIYSNNLSDNYVIYDGRIKFKLGNCDDLENKIYRGLAACEQLNESSPNVKGTMTITSDKSVYFTEEFV